MKIWYLLITEKFLFYSFRKWEIRSFLEPKSWLKDDIYWLLKRSCFELFGDGKYGLFLSQEVDGKMIFTGYWEVVVLNFSVMGNTVFFSAKNLMERWYLRGLFELPMIFQDLGNMVFRAVGYMDSWKRFNEIQLPSKDKFYTTLNLEDISDDDYAHWINVWNTFNINNLGEYHNLMLD